MKTDKDRFYTILKDYLTVYLPTQKEYSPNTVKSYREALNVFLTHTAEINGKPIHKISFQDVSAETINAFVDFLLNERKCAPITVNQRIVVIRSFLKYTGIRFPDLNYCYVQIQKVPFMKVRKTETVNYFSENALNVILKQPDPKRKTEHRNLFFMILLYDTGARDQEILDLHPADIVATGKSSFIVLHGKGGKIRSVPIMEKTVEHFNSYIKRFNLDRNDKKTPLFFTTSHDEKHKMSDDNVARFIDSYAEAARRECDEVPENVTPHMFRHSRAIHLYRKGVPLVLISEWLGHSQLETTLIYAYADTEMKRKAIEAATDQNHPLRRNRADMCQNSEEEFKKSVGLL